MNLHFTKSVDLNQLHDELLAGCAEMRPVGGFARMTVQGDEHNVLLTLPDDLSLEAQQQISAIVANHTPKVQSQPNWAQFRAQVSMHSAYFRLVTGNPQNGVLNDLLTPLLWRIGEQPELLIEVAAVWNAMEANVSLTGVEIDQLNAIATACNVPLRLNAQGQITVN